MIPQHYKKESLTSHNTKFSYKDHPSNRQKVVLMENRS